MATVTIVRTTSASQISSLLTKASASATYAPITNPVFPSDIQVDGQINLLLNQSSPSTYINGFTANGAEFLRVQSGGAIDLDAKSITLSSTSAGIEIFGTISHSSGNFNTGGNISATGRITMTSQPYFHVRSSHATPVGSDVLWNTVDRNSGSYYNTSNGRFTAPVSGTYIFSAHGLYPNATAADMRVGLYKNGNEVQGNRFINTKVANTWQTFYANDIIYLNANDYVTVRFVQGSGTLHTDINYNGFRGWLLG